VRIWPRSMGSVQMSEVGGPISEHARTVDTLELDPPGVGHITHHIK
jgi:hypothetical protein